MRLRVPNVSEGVLEVRGTTGTGATTVQNTATLAGAGSIQSSTGTVVQSGGTLQAGNNLGNDIGTLAFAGPLTAGDGSNLVFQLSGSTGTAPDPLNSISGAFLNGAPGNHDHLDITGAFSLSSTTTITINLFNYSAGMGDVFNLVDWSLAGAATANGFDPGTDFNFAGAALGDGLSWGTDRFISDGVIYVVPEPSQTLLMLVGSLYWIVRRRRA